MLETMRKKRADGGFTLVELLITIVIIGVLAAVVILAIGGLSDSGEKAACTATKDAAETAAIAYYADNGEWPDDVETDLAAYLEEKNGVDIEDNEISGADWFITLGADGQFSECPGTPDP